MALHEQVGAAVDVEIAGHGRCTRLTAASASASVKSGRAVEIDLPVLETAGDVVAGRAVIRAAINASISRAGIRTIEPASPSRCWSTAWLT